VAVILTSHRAHDRLEITTRTQCGRLRRPADAERERHEPGWIRDQSGQDFDGSTGLAQLALTVDALGKLIERLSAEAEQGGFEIQPLPQPARLDCLLAIIEVSNGDEGRALPRAWHRTPSPWSRR
jgi:hypothetical protein